MTENLSSDVIQVRENLLRIEQDIQNACAACGRRREEITLMAVTKTVDPVRINAAIEAGVTCIGENRVQEFLQKRDDLRLAGVQKHLIGHLQTNKVRQIVGQVDMIQSVDSERLAQAISEQSLKRTGAPTDVLVEVNIGNEDSKSGVSVEELEPLLWKIGEFSGIRVRGLMTIPPILESDAEKRAIFSKMKQLFIDIQSKKVDNVSMDILSMGMSSDYVQAVLEGSTLVRIGSSLFGKRV